MTLAGKPRLEPFAVDALEEDPASICAVSADLRIAYVNRAWSRFAADNGVDARSNTWGVGACRRLRRHDSSSWEWVPRFVTRPLARTSHRLCRLCSDLYYPDVGNT